MKPKLITKPVYEAGPKLKITGRANPSMTLVSNELIPGCNLYLEVGWIWDMPDPNPHIFEHSHDYDEIVLHLGSNPQDPEDLGAEIEFVVEGEPLVFDRTSALFIPAGTKHGPVTWRRCSRPHMQMAIMLGAGSYAEGWKEDVGKKKED